MTSLNKSNTTFPRHPDPFNPNRIIQRIIAYFQTTPGKLIWRLLIIWLVLAITAAIACKTYSDLKNTIQTVGQDTVPSIVAAENIRATLADANAYGVNAFLVNESGLGFNRQKYRQDMNNVHNAIITASQNITYGDEERIPILNITSHLAHYEELMGIAQAQNPKDAMQSLDQAQKIMREQILPSSSALDSANFSHLSSTYSKNQSQHMAWQKITLFFGTLLIIVLCFTQFFLFAKMKRIMNIPLLVATILSILYLGFMVVHFNQAQKDLQIAKQDAFDSVHALWKARAVAYDANTDESLFLLYHGDTSAQKISTQVFQDKVSILSNGDVEADLKNAYNKHTFGGYLGDELANITFGGEQEAALKTMEFWATYNEIDSRIRLLENQNKHAEAVALNLGNQKGQSNWTFAQFDQALGQTLNINQKEFEQGIKRAFDNLGSFIWITILWALLVIFSSFWGIKPRLDEYRF